jgi:hypothetical protein
MVLGESKNEALRFFIALIIAWQFVGLVRIIRKNRGQPRFLPFFRPVSRAHYTLGGLAATIGFIT